MHVHVRMHVRVYTHVYVHAHGGMYAIHVSMDGWMDVSVYGINTYMCLNTYVCVCTNVYIDMSIIYFRPCRDTWYKVS